MTFCDSIEMEDFVHMENTLSIYVMYIACMVSLFDTSHPEVVIRIANATQEMIAMFLASVEVFDPSRHIT